MGASVGTATPTPSGRATPTLCTQGLVSLASLGRSHAQHLLSDLLSCPDLEKEAKGAPGAGSMCSALRGYKEGA